LFIILSSLSPLNHSYSYSYSYSYSPSVLLSLPILPRQQQKKFAICFFIFYFVPSL
jgi:hypothetical protein